MITKTDANELQDYLADASNIAGGNADRLLIPETRDEVANAVGASEGRITISGARTGTVGGAVPDGGTLISLEKLDQILSINKERRSVTVGAGVLLADLQKAVQSEGLYYPPDPTEWSCQMGGTVATNASGARSFKYGSTRDFVKRIEVVLANGDDLTVRRGNILSNEGRIAFKTNSGTKISAKLPTYSKPSVRKDACGYFAGERVDLIDLFIGSEGTLGIITEVELALVKKPEGSFSGIVFFPEHDDLLGFVEAVRDESFRNRRDGSEGIDATFVEYFDPNSIALISEKFSEAPDGFAGAVFFEQETTEESEEELLEAWTALFERFNAAVEESWFAVSEEDLEKMKEFRHALPVTVNERVVRNKQRKIGTDMAVPDKNFRSFLGFCRAKLEESGIENVTFGHIGDCHLHINLLPVDDEEANRASNLYGRFVAQSIMLGGTVSAEHGIGKLKSKYLYVMYGERYLNEMAELKKAFDPDVRLGFGNMIDERFL
ncbi:MAG: FAD-binding oxidoreductase [Acidobacteria bacterium]|nr:MAG: FAD-binding oxidoreductase [Acidobacteriota bacterium]REK01147.1 MAG: FAD-binding oxidoreductase [Acidobacteriota bacterium]REK14103.1 MAG: FAD-binding oxidoreductase [Acidobacteriota bacterium]REK44818.1 MAG: FAD-binding oxidoreductase [Acidobacteriota bacterium]